MAAKWKATEKVKHYSITGSTGRALYVAIGKKGPRLKGGRQTIAHTTFDLKWRRNYKPVKLGNGKACRLVSAKPFFTIIYTLPRVVSKMPPYMEREWKIFYAGIAEHEKVHGVYAREMVAQIIDTTVGLTVQNDPKCKKIRTEVLERVKTAYADYKAKGRIFDRTEMSAGGNVRGLVGKLLGR